jgi:hypothetical protein
VLLPITSVARDVDTTDLTDLTTAERTGPAVWVAGGLEVPFNRDLTQDEVDAVVLRLTTVDDGEEQLRGAVEAFLSVESPTVAEQRAQLKSLTHLVLRLLETR